jgi:curved DNA binding protein
MESVPKENLTAPGVMEKFKAAGKIAQDVLAVIREKCVDGADINELCMLGDNMIVEECSKIYNNKKTEKGVAFPVCISLNDVCGHYSPLKSESAKIANGDLVKIDLGVHIDGYPVLLAHSIIAGGKANDDGAKLRALSAAYDALETAAKLLRPNNTNHQVTSALNKVITAYNCQPVEGVLSHDLKRYVIDGNNVIISKENPENKVTQYEFKTEDVFSLDIFVTANETEGKTKESELRTTVFKRNIDISQDLKTKNGRSFLTEIKTRFHDMAFSLNSFEDELKARSGVNECTKTSHVQPYPVLQEKSKNPVAHFKWTVAVSSKRILILAGITERGFESAKRAAIEDTVVQGLLDTPLVDFTTKQKKK